MFAQRHTTNLLTHVLSPPGHKPQKNVDDRAAKYVQEQSLPSSRKTLRSRASRPRLVMHRIMVPKLFYATATTGVAEA